MGKTYGRLDYLGDGKWRVIVYKGAKDVKLSEHGSREEAVDALQDWIAANK